MSTALFHLRTPKDKALRQYQEYAIWWALDRPAALIGDDPGLGKTVIVIGLLNMICLTCRNVLIVCPASIKIQWQRHIEKWHTGDLTAGVVSGSKWVDNDVVIINYDILQRHEQGLHGRAWDCIVLDECQRLKNPKAIRSKMIYGGAVKDRKVERLNGRRIIAMTGTPVENRPRELFPILNYLDPDEWPDFWQFGRRYCNGHRKVIGRLPGGDLKKAWDFDGSSNLDELRERLYGGLMLRRLKADVLPELPDKTREIIELPSDGCLKVLRLEYEAILDELGIAHKGTSLAEMKRLADAIDTDEIMVQFEAMSRVRKETAIAKIPMAIDHLTGLLETQKVVLFLHHTDVYHRLIEAFPGAVGVIGQHTQVQRQGALEKFRDDPECKLFLASIRAVGTGFDGLQEVASYGVFIEDDWVPGVITQCEDRLWRMGQQNPVFIQHLVLAGSIDVRVIRLLVQKQTVVRAVTG